MGEVDGTIRDRSVGITTSERIAYDALIKAIETLPPERRAAFITRLRRLSAKERSVLVRKMVGH